MIVSSIFHGIPKDNNFPCHRFPERRQSPWKIPGSVLRCRMAIPSERFTLLPCLCLAKSSNLLISSSIMPLISICLLNTVNLGRRVPTDARAKLFTLPMNRRDAPFWFYAFPFDCRVIEEQSFLTHQKLITHLNWIVMINENWLIKRLSIDSLNLSEDLLPDEIVLFAVEWMFATDLPFSSGPQRSRDALLGAFPLNI